MALQGATGNNYALFGGNSVVTPSGDFSVAFFVRPTANVPGLSYGVIVSGQTSGGVGWDIGFAGDLNGSANTNLYVGFHSTGYYGYADSGISAPLNTWTGFVVRFHANGAASTYSIVNAAGTVVYTSGTLGAQWVSQTNALLGLKRSADNAGSTFAGGLDYVRIFNKVLSTTECQDVLTYNDIPAALNSSTIAEIVTTNPSGTTVTIADQGPNSLGTATKTGTVTWLAGPSLSPLPGGTNYPRSISSSVSISASVGRAKGSSRPVSISVSPSTSASRSIATSRQLSNSLGSSPSVSKAIGYKKSSSSSIGLIPNFIRALSLFRPAAFSLASSAALFKTIVTTRPISSSILPTSLSSRFIVIARAYSINAAHFSLSVISRTALRSFSSSTSIVSQPSRLVQMSRGISNPVAFAGQVSRLYSTIRSASATNAFSSSAIRRGTFGKTLSVSRAVSGTVSTASGKFRPTSSTTSTGLSLARSLSLYRPRSSFISSSSLSSRALVLARPLSASGASLSLSLNRIYKAYRLYSSTLPSLQLIDGRLTLLRAPSIFISSFTAHISTSADKVFNITSSVPVLMSAQRAQTLLRLYLTTIGSSSVSSRLLTNTRTASVSVSSSSQVSSARKLYRLSTSNLNFIAAFSRRETASRSISQLASHTSSASNSTLHDFYKSLSLGPILPSSASARKVTSNRNLALSSINFTSSASTRLVLSRLLSRSIAFLAVAQRSSSINRPLAFSSTFSFGLNRMQGLFRSRLSIQFPLSSFQISRDTQRSVQSSAGFDAAFSDSSGFGRSLLANNSSPSHSTFRLIAASRMSLQTLSNFEGLLYRELRARRSLTYLKHFHADLDRNGPSVRSIQFDASSDTSIAQVIKTSRSMLVSIGPSLLSFNRAGHFRRTSSWTRNPLALFSNGLENIYPIRTISLSFRPSTISLLNRPSTVHLLYRSTSLSLPKELE